MSRFLLASASPQREKLLKEIGLKFSVVPSSVDESICKEADPVNRSVSLAKMKAQDVFDKNPDACVLGADTLVVSSDGTLLEKPANESEARSMLRMHSGNTSLVHSSLCLLLPSSKVLEITNSSSVTFSDLGEETIDWWIKTGEWENRSGAFQIEGKGQIMIERIEGNFTGVVGLPIFEFGKILNDAGLTIESFI
ncbi:septum formation protein Maf [Candidatus Peregrinibacteria bacterium]|nr:septum formation protein Maf [Candidatus Peregrinibacteria bacterium]MBT3598573.1 septum formation protein Maf [Candidatus Peregrinibacteria bacterium]MBT6730568.1 septum formation protein Maf [Candidatus Peregrinibacteria bacterium]MBT7009454.1 septum formation protein Maf [Candidatus Peregrinibacteria bacterium]MBT7344832.1 septum formation protein Maf [Candidatus Peregrinibacteria bacterium]